MRVITLNREAFAAKCRELRASVADSGFFPELTVAIATGGVYVAEAMGYADAETVTLQRSGTATKRSLLDGMLKRLPSCVTNMMRIAEAKILEWSDRNSDQPAPITLPEALMVKLLKSPGRVLVIDDAVDSGKTLGSVVAALHGALPAADIRSAVITVTREKPALRPEYALYADRTLIRFPWSGDYNEKCYE
jgi:hypoxanthine phosphoribosyltransferase